MKKLLCFVVLLSTCVSAFSQQYQYVPTTAYPAMWQVITYYEKDDSASLTKECTQFNFQFTMDGSETLAYGFNWKNITKREYSVKYKTFLGQPCRLPDVTARVATMPDEFYTFIKEDNKIVDEKSFYQFQPFFDFNKGIGHGTNVMGLVEAIDTILVDGGLRRRFSTSRNYNNNVVHDTIIEGIGSITRGLIPIPFGPQSKLTCFESNGKIIYQNLDYPCGVIFPMGTPTDVSNITEPSETLIYPNPFTDYITIANTPPGTMATVYNNTGQRIIQASTETGTFETSSLSPGVYHFFLRSPEGAVIYTQRVTKQD